MIHFSERLKLVDLYDRWRKENKVGDGPFSVISFIQHMGALDEYRVHQYLDGALRARDRAQIPGDENKTPMDAKYTRLHDLLKKYQGIPEKCTCWEDYKCKRRETVARCQDCPLWVALDHIGARATCCNWAAESKPDMAIWVLEQLLKEEDEMHRSVNLYREPERPTEPPKEKTYYCPVCGEENPERYFRNNLMDIVGCNHCIEELDAADWELDHEE